ncbi:MAG: hypothetical protein QM479_06205, partial [Pseudomonadota bacterium]
YLSFNDTHKTTTTSTEKLGSRFYFSYPLGRIESNNITIKTMASLLKPLGYQLAAMKNGKTVELLP